MMTKLQYIHTELLHHRVLRHICAVMMLLLRWWTHKSIRPVAGASTNIRRVSYTVETTNMKVVLPFSIRFFSSYSISSFTVIQLLQYHAHSYCVYWLFLMTSSKSHEHHCCCSDWRLSSPNEIPHLRDRTTVACSGGTTILYPRYFQRSPHQTTENSGIMVLNETRYSL